MNRPRYSLRVVLLLLAITSFVSIANAQDLRNWFTAETKHYIVRSDASEKLSRDVADLMETNYALYSKLLDRTPPDATPKFKVELLKDVDEYVQRQKVKYRQRKYDNPFALPQYFYHHYHRDTSRNVVCGFVIHDFPMSQRLRHEGFHQFFRSMVPYAPQWLNEGIAEMLEGCRWNRDRQMRLAVNYGMLRRMREGILDEDPGPLASKYEYIPVEKIIKASKSDWLRTEAVSYAESWAICYFVMNGPHEEYRSVLRDAIAACQKGVSREENTKNVLAASFGKLDMNEFERRLLDYFRDLKPEQHDSFLSGQKLARAKSSLPAAETEFSKYVNANMLDPRGYYHRGACCYSQARFDDAERDLKRALDLFPEYWSAQYVLGKVYYYKRDLESAEKHLKLARRFGGSAKALDPWFSKIEKMKQRQQDKK